MYTPGPNDLSGRNFQTEMRDMLISLLTAYEIRFAANIGPKLIMEFDDMLEFSGRTVTGVDDRPQAVIDYVRHHYLGAPKPTWYANLTQGS